MSVKIISFMNRKGGVGKSTICTLLASTLHHREKCNILVIDADNQHSIFKHRENEIQEFKNTWLEDGPIYDIVPFYWQKEGAWDVPVSRFKDLIQENESKYDIILIDSPGKQEGEEIPIIIMASDVVIVPLIASSYDINSTIDFLQVLPPIAEIKRKKGLDLKVFGVVNKKDRSVEYEVIKELDGYNGLKMFNSSLSLLVRYKREKSTYRELLYGVGHMLKDEYNDLYKEFLEKCEL